MAKKVEKTNKKENNKNKKSFFKDFKAELKKVIWPTPKQLLNNTTAVVVIVLITAAIVFVLDLAFESINKNGIDKIKTIVEQSNSISEGETTDEASENNESDEIIDDSTGEATEENTENETNSDETENITTETNNEVTEGEKTE